jgi:hypothetical protein
MKSGLPQNKSALICLLPKGDVKTFEANTDHCVMTGQGMSLHFPHPFSTWLHFRQSVVFVLS